MMRTEWTVTVHSLATGETIGEATRYAHNSALRAGIAIVREHARETGVLYQRSDGRKVDGVTRLDWIADRGKPRTVQVTVRQAQ